MKYISEKENVLVKYVVNSNEFNDKMKYGVVLTDKTLSISRKKKSGLFNYVMIEEFVNSDKIVGACISTKRYLSSLIVSILFFGILLFAITWMIRNEIELSTGFYIIFSGLSLLGIMFLYIYLYFGEKVLRIIIGASDFENPFVPTEGKSHDQVEELYMAIKELIISRKK